jgi:integrase/recombinase XerD
MSTDLLPHPISAGVVPFDAAMLAGQLAPSSIDMYARDFRAYLAFAESPAAALEPATLARWRAVLAADTAFSPNTINRMLSAVKRLMKEAAVQGYASHETAKAFEEIAGVKAGALKDRTKQHARTRIPPAAMRRLCEAPDHSTLRGLRDTAILATLASSGVRVAELASLTVGQILSKGSGYMLSIRGKNDTEYREAPLSREAHRLIMAWIGARPILSQHVFTSFAGRGQRATGEPLSEVAVWRIVQAYAAQVELSHIKPHDFRRFVGTQLAKGDIRKAQKALGHKRIDTTARHYVLDELEPGLTDDLY